VSCGKAPVATLPYEELFNIIDNVTWLFTAVSTLGVTMLSGTLINSSQSSILRAAILHICSMFRSGSAFSGFLLIFRALVEQGDPISSSFIRNRKLQLAFGPFLLMTLVLSNAYKNKNITKITLPRAPVQFDTIESLYEHSFSICCRVISTGNSNTKAYHK